MRLFDVTSEKSAPAFETMISLCDAWQKGEVSFGEVLRWSENIGFSSTDISDEYDCGELMVDLWKEGRTEPAKGIACDLVSRLQNKAVRALTGSLGSLAFT